MAQSSIITGQYVELTQTPASVGDRLIAAIIDWAALFTYFTSISLLTFNALDKAFLYNDVIMITCLVIISLPVIVYFPACEIFANGQSLGKRAMKIRVVTVDGNSPTIGSCLLRWFLYPIDTMLTGFLGIVFIVFGKHRQRLGDLAAGTMVIKMTASSYDFYSLSDYSYIQPGYEPTYPEAASLSTRQIDVIQRTLYNSDIGRRSEFIYKLALQVQQFLGVQLTENVPADTFLKVIINDFYYYSSTIDV